MEHNLLAPGIRFNDWLFSEPRPFANWKAPKCAGLFGLLVPDQNWAPKALKPIYFGEFGNNVLESVLPIDPGSLLVAAKGKLLLVTVLLMPFSTTAQRSAVRTELVWAYSPICQTDVSSIIFANNVVFWHGEPRNTDREQKVRRAIGFVEPEVT